MPVLTNNLATGALALGGAVAAAGIAIAVQVYVWSMANGPDELQLSIAPLPQSEPSDN